MKSKKKIILGLLSISIILSISLSNTINLPSTFDTQPKIIDPPYSSAIDPILYESYITIGGSYIASAVQIELDSSNNIYVTGEISATDTEDSDAFLAKFNSDGNIIWYTIWGGAYDDSGGGIAFDSLGNVYMGGSTASFGPSVPNANWFLAKFNSAGTQIWNHSWGTIQGEWGGRIVVDSLDNIYYIGSTWGYSMPSADVGITKFNSAGVIQWFRDWGPGGYDSPRDITVDSSDNIYIIAGSDTRGIGGRDVALIKYDSAGTFLWATAWGGTGYDDPKALAIDEYGSIYITGMTDSFGVGNYDVFIAMYNSTATKLWNYTWGGVNSDIPGDMVLDTSRNLYIAGYTESFGSGSSDIVHLMFDSYGIKQWNETWGGSELEECTGICIDASNNTFIAGKIESFNAITSNALILKFNGTGQEEWYKTWDGESRDECRDIAFDSSNNYYITGFSEVLGNGGRDAILFKYNPLGNQEWNLTWGGSELEEANGIGIDSNDDIYITGKTESYGPGTSSAFLLKFNSTGDLLWNFTWSGPYDESGIGIAFDSLGNVYMGGSTSSFGPSVPMRNWFLAKFNSIGTQIWNHSWGTVEGEGGGKIVVDSVDNIYYVGSTWGYSSPSADVGITKFNSAGVIQWFRDWGPGGYDSPRDITVDTSDNIYIVAGSDTRGFGGRDVVLIKYDSAGTFQWAEGWGSTGTDEPRSLTLDNSGNIYITGRTNSFGEGDDDIMIIVYDEYHTLKWSYLFSGNDADEGYTIHLDSSYNLVIGGVTQSFATGSGDMILLSYEIDMTPPEIAIIDPINSEFYGVNSPDFEISIIEDNFESSWYTLDDGANNVTFSGLTGTINQTEWVKNGNGSVTIRFYIQDSAGFENSSEVTVWKDIISPVSSISFIPYKETSIVNALTEFSITAEDVDGCGVAIIKYRIDSGSWIDYTGAFNLSGYSLGNYEIEYYAIDILDNTEDVNTLNVQLVDITVPPGISGYNVAFIIGLVVIFSMPFLHKKLKKQK